MAGSLEAGPMVATILVLCLGRVMGKKKKSGSGMGGIVNPLEAVGAHVGVDLRGGKAGMAKERLHAAEVGPAIQEVGGKSMAQFVGAGAIRQLGLASVFAQEQPD